MSETVDRMERNISEGKPAYDGICGKPCALGKPHDGPGWNGMVYCEHGLSDFACDVCSGRPDTYDPICETCGVAKENHTEVEAMLCITRQIAGATDRNLYIAGLPGTGRKP